MHLHNSRTSAAEARAKQPRQSDAKLNMQRPNIIKIKHFRLHGSRNFQPEQKMTKNTNILLCVRLDVKIKARYNLHEALNAIMLRKQMLPMTLCDYQQQICSLMRKSLFICEALK